MRALLCAISCTALLSACSTVQTPEPVVTIQRVEIPVEVPCTVTVPSKPKSDLGKAARPTTLDAAVVSIMRELEEYRAYASLLEIALSRCATIKP